MSHRIMVYWPPRAASLSEQGGALFKALTGLRGCGEPFGDWSALLPPSATPQPVRSAADAVEALRARTIHWRTGDDEHTSYQARLVAEQAPELAELNVTSGIEPLGLDAIFTPNRAELRVDAASAALAPAALHAMLRALVDAFSPLFGFAGSAELPLAPTAIVSDGRPPVGWLTYLARGYPSLPPSWPTPTVAYGWPEGTLVAAHPELFDERNPEHRAAMDRVRTLLDEAGVRVPHHRVATTP